MRVVLESKAQGEGGIVVVEVDPLSPEESATVTLAGEEPETVTGPRARLLRGHAFALLEACMLEAEAEGEATPGCSQTGCPFEVEGSLVWPGKGRVHYCALHLTRALAVLKTLGISLDAVDMKPAAGAPGFEDPSQAERIR